METELWFRNPHDYVRELVECGVGNIIWDRGMLVKKNVDPMKHADLYYGEAIPYRILVSGEQGTAEYHKGDGLSTPRAVYPTFLYGEPASLLEEMIDQPVGQDEEVCNDTSVPLDLRPVFGQEHRVVIYNMPSSSMGPGKGFLKYLATLQEDYPDCIIHVHGMYGYRSLFGLGFRSVDFEPRITAQKGKVVIPAGRELAYEQMARHTPWLKVLGYKLSDLQIPRNRCMFNIKSSQWAAKYFREEIKFQTVKSTLDFSQAPEQAESNRIFLGNPKVGQGDKFHCDTCSLALTCRYYRQGAICTVPGAETNDLAKMFNTRDSELILDGMGLLMGLQTKRLERGLAEEDMFGELTPEVTKIINQLLTHGQKLAKLVNPALRSPQIAVNVGAGGNANVSIGNPKAVIGAAIRELEMRGIKREDITPEMLTRILNTDNQPKAIEGEIIEQKLESA